MGCAWVAADSTKDVKDCWGVFGRMRDRATSVVFVKYLLLKESTQILCMSQGTTGEMGGCRVINSFTVELSNHTLEVLNEREKKRWDAATLAGARMEKGRRRSHFQSDTANL